MMDLKPGGCTIYLSLEEVNFQWRSTSAGGDAAPWSDERSIGGQATLNKALYVARNGKAAVEPLRRIDVTLHPASGGHAERMLAVQGARGFTSTSYLSHFEATPATREDRAQPEAVFLTLTIPDTVFDRAWRELNDGVSPKTLQIGALLHCQIVEYWMEQYYIEPGSLNPAEPTYVTVLGRVSPLVR